jgi:hypothetical protein
VQAVVIWQHGTYKTPSDGTITTDPTIFSGDGRVQVQDACASQSSIISYYDQPGLYKNYAISQWRGQTMLQVRRPRPLRFTRLTIGSMKARGVRWEPHASHVPDLDHSLDVHAPNEQSQVSSPPLVLVPPLTTPQQLFLDNFLTPVLYVPPAAAYTGRLIPFDDFARYPPFTRVWVSTDRTSCNDLAMVSP